MSRCFKYGQTDMVEKGNYSADYYTGGRMHTERKSSMKTEEREINDEGRFCVRDAERYSYKGSGKINRWECEYMMDITDNLVLIYKAHKEDRIKGNTVGLNNDKDYLHTT